MQIFKAFTKQNTKNKNSTLKFISTREYNFYNTLFSRDYIMIISLSCWYKWMQKYKIVCVCVWFSSYTFNTEDEIRDMQSNERRWEKICFRYTL